MFLQYALAFPSRDVLKTKQDWQVCSELNKETNQPTQNIGSSYLRASWIETKAQILTERQLSLKY